MDNRYDELSPQEQVDIDELINTLAAHKGIEHQAMQKAKTTGVRRATTGIRTAHDTQQRLDEGREAYHENVRKLLASGVGTPATIAIGSDCYPGTVIQLRETNVWLTVTVQQDNERCVKRNSGYGSEEYEYDRNPEGARRTFKFRKDTGKQVGREPHLVSFGHRRYYRDPHF